VRAIELLLSVAVHQNWPASQREASGVSRTGTAAVPLISPGGAARPVRVENEPDQHRRAERGCLEENEDTPKEMSERCFREFR
jgi:hypothetical protein